MVIIIDRAYKIIVACIELFYSIPLIGGALIIAKGWTPLVMLLFLHMVGLIILANKKKSKAGHILGVIGNVVGFIPGIGWIFHLITGTILLIEGLLDK